MSRERSKRWSVLMFLLGLLVAAPGTWAQDASGEDDAHARYAARHLLRRAEELLEMGERERGLRMLESLVRQYPTSEARFQAYLLTGRSHHEAREFAKAVETLTPLTALGERREELSVRQRDQYLEGLYLTGVSHFHMRNFAPAFATLRRITENFPNTVWANQAYFYIGMAHFAQENWNRAIEALSLVGTFVDPDSPAVEYVEAGRRLHVKIEDADLPVLYRLGQTVELELTTGGGDREVVEAHPLAGDSSIFLASIPTVPGDPVPGDGALQLSGGDTITVSYVDYNTSTGEREVERRTTVEVVSSANLMFTLGTYETRAAAAFLDQPVFLRLQDLDLSTSPNPDSATVIVRSEYRADAPSAAEDQPALTVDLDILLREDADEYAVRDTVTLELTETAGRSGVFTGRVDIRPEATGRPANASDPVLLARRGDRITAVYTDERHIGGTFPSDVEQSIEVIGEMQSVPMSSQNVVTDPVLRARKELVEAEALLELARIFRSMGLTKGARERSEEGLARLEFVMQEESLAASELREQAFQLRWNLFLAQDNLPAAMATCRLFNQLYPESPLVDSALMGIGNIYLEREEYPEAVRVFREILALPHSRAKAEALFRIAEIEETLYHKAVAEAQTQGSRPPAQTQLERAIATYHDCARRYPDSAFAGRALGKVIDYHIETRDYAQADELLTQVFEDYRDEGFLDSMLLKWVLVAFRMGDFQKAEAKCQQLLFEYPGSGPARTAQELLPRIQARLGRAPGA